MKRSVNYDGLCLCLDKALSGVDCVKKGASEYLKDAKIFTVGEIKNKDKLNYIEGLTQDDIGSFTMPFQSVFFDYNEYGCLVFQQEKDQVGVDVEINIVLFTGLDDNGIKPEKYKTGGNFRFFIIQASSFDPKGILKLNISRAFMRINENLYEEQTPKYEDVVVSIMFSVIYPCLKVCDTKNFVVQISEPKNKKKIKHKSPSMNKLRYIFADGRESRRIAGIKEPSSRTGRKVLERRAHWAKAHWRKCENKPKIWIKKCFKPAIWNGQNENTIGNIHYKIIL